ncbi:MAG TPA: hypothetical protein VHN14_22620 [Kofleriaceae bacterium]|jgi:hypothetical protein|nr:hypothetical protein [Kofleriaceae bacterium]
MRLPAERKSVLARTDPSFDLAPTLGYFEATQSGDGLWRALGPEAPWFTAESSRSRRRRAGRSRCGFAMSARS